ncbi:MAG: response regulator, partial [Magnetococcales bacterium]|nr:response regulator [Magnetococcales bacterium]
MKTMEQPRILVVDDQAANRTALTMLLATIDAEVITAAGGNEALIEITQHRFALLLLDVDMPGMDGYEVARMVRSVEETRDIPIVFLTAAFNDDLHRMMAYEAGGIDYIEKPIDEQILLAKVTLFLELFRRKQESEALNARLQQELQVRREISRELRDHQIRLNELAEQYRDLYDNAPDMYASVDAESATVKQCNLTLAKKLGYTKEEIVGRPIFDLYHRDCMADVKKAFQSFVTTGSVVNAELMLQRQNGQGIPVMLNVSAVRDESGAVQQSRSSWRDISDRKEVEDKLQESEKRFRELVGNLPGIIYRCRMDTDWTMVHISDMVETITGYPASDFIKNR